MTKASESSNLDLLRSIAVLSVLAAHLMVFLGEPTLWRFTPRPLGGLGVLLFFVHTCLVLMFSLERQERKYGERMRFGIFMIRRIFRIYPLSVSVVLAIIAFRIPSTRLYPGSMEFLEMPWRGYAANLLLMQNVTGTKSILGPLWSLPFEIQMYVLLPLLFVLIRKVRSLWLLLVVWALAVVPALLEERVPGMRLAAYLPCFLPGVFAYWISSRKPATWPAAAWPALILVLVLSYTAFPHPLSGMAVCLVTGLTVTRFRETSTAWMRRAAHLVAKYSYGIYLSHYFAIWTAFGVLKDHPLAVRVAAFVVLATGLPVLMYHSIEAPMINTGTRLIDRFVGKHAIAPAAARTVAPAVGPAVVSESSPS